MAKTIEEISKDLDEWIDENEKERSVFMIAGFENDDLQIKAQGAQAEIIAGVASAMVDCAEVRRLITSALDLVNKCKPQEGMKE